VDPVPDPLILKKSGSAGNGTRASGSVFKNSDYYTTEAVHNEMLRSSYYLLIIRDINQETED
jgi:hypothetical protein